MQSQYQKDEKPISIIQDNRQENRQHPYRAYNIQRESEVPSVSHEELWKQQLNTPLSLTPVFDPNNHRVPSFSSNWSHFQVELFFNDFRNAASVDPLSALQHLCNEITDRIPEVSSIIPNDSANQNTINSVNSELLLQDFFSRAKKEIEYHTKLFPQTQESLELCLELGQKVRNKNHLTLAEQFKQSQIDIAEKLVAKKLLFHDYISTVQALRTFESREDQALILTNRLNALPVKHAVTTLNNGILFDSLQLSKLNFFTPLKEQAIRNKKIKDVDTGLKLIDLTKSLHNQPASFELIEDVTSGIPDPVIKIDLLNQLTLDGQNKSFLTQIKGKVLESFGLLSTGVQKLSKLVQTSQVFNEIDHDFSIKQKNDALDLAPHVIVDNGINRTNEIISLFNDPGERIGICLEALNQWNNENSEPPTITNSTLYNPPTLWGIPQLVLPGPSPQNPHHILLNTAINETQNSEHLLQVKNSGAKHNLFEFPQITESLLLKSITIQDVEKAKNDIIEYVPKVQKFEDQIKIGCSIIEKSDQREIEFFTSSHLQGLIKNSPNSPNRIALELSIYDQLRSKKGDLADNFYTLAIEDASDLLAEKSEQTVAQQILDSLPNPTDKIRARLCAVPKVDLHLNDKNQAWLLKKAFISDAISSAEKIEDLDLAHPKNIPTIQFDEELASGYLNKTTSITGSLPNLKDINSFFLNIPPISRAKAYANYYKPEFKQNPVFESGYLEQVIQTFDNLPNSLIGFKTQVEVRDNFKKYQVDKIEDITNKIVLSGGRLIAGSGINTFTNIQTFLKDPLEQNLILLTATDQAKGKKERIRLLIKAVGLTNSIEQLVVIRRKAVEVGLWRKFQVQAPYLNRFLEISKTFPQEELLTFLNEIPPITQVLIIHHILRSLPNQEFGIKLADICVDICQYELEESLRSFYLKQLANIAHSRELLHSQSLTVKLVLSLVYRGLFQSAETILKQNHNALIDVLKQTSQSLPGFSINVLREQVTLNQKFIFSKTHVGLLSNILFSVAPFGLDRVVKILNEEITYAEGKLESITPFKSKAFYKNVSRDFNTRYYDYGNSSGGHNGNFGGNGRGKGRYNRYNNSGGGSGGSWLGGNGGNGSNGGDGSNDGNRPNGSNNPQFVDVLRIKVEADYDIFIRENEPQFFLELANILRVDPADIFVLSRERGSVIYRLIVGFQGAARSFYHKFLNNHPDIQRLAYKVNVGLDSIIKSKVDRERKESKLLNDKIHSEFPEAEFAQEEVLEIFFQENGKKDKILNGEIQFDIPTNSERSCTQFVLPFDHTQYNAIFKALLQVTYPKEELKSNRFRIKVNQNNWRNDHLIILNGLGLISGEGIKLTPSFWAKMDSLRKKSPGKFQRIFPNSSPPYKSLADLGVREFTKDQVDIFCQKKLIDSVNLKVDILTYIGETLFQSIAQDSQIRKVLLDHIEHHPDTNIRFSVNPDSVLLDQYPWELISSGRRHFLLDLLSRDLARSITGKPPRPIPICDPLKILYVESRENKTGRYKEEGKEEGKAVEEALKPLVNAKKIELKKEKYYSPTFEQFIDELTVGRFHVLHFDGHGEFGRLCSNPECGTIFPHEDFTLCPRCEAPLYEPKGYLEFRDRSRKEKEWIDSERLKKLFAEEASCSLRLVVFSACNSSRTAEKNLFAGVAQATLLAGIPSVIAMQLPIDPLDSPIFMFDFYRHLGETGNIRDAVSAGRNRLYIVPKTSKESWYIPSMYLRSKDGTGQLLKIEEKEKSANVS